MHANLLRLPDVGNANDNRNSNNPIGWRRVRNDWGGSLAYRPEKDPPSAIPKILFIGKPWETERILRFPKNLGTK